MRSTQAREELNTWRSLPYSLFADGVINGLALTIRENLNKEAR